MNHKGFSLIEIVIALTVASVGFVAVSTLVVSGVELQSRQAVREDFLSNQLNTILIVTDNAAWEETVKNGDFKCISRGNCPQSSPLQLRRSNGSIYHNGNSPTAGFDRGNNPCNTYPSEDCPIKLDLTFEDYCSSCEPKKVLVKARYGSHAGDSDLNLSKYGFDLIRDLPKLVDCSQPFSFTQEVLLLVLGRTRLNSDAFSSDGTTRNQICEVLGCGPSTGFNGRCHNSCGNNSLTAFRSGSFNNINSCAAGGCWMGSVSCSDL